MQHRNGRGPRVGLQPFADRKAVDIGQFDGKNDERRLLLGRQFERIYAGGGFDDLISRLAEDFVAHAARRGIGIDGENSVWHSTTTDQ